VLSVVVGMPTVLGGGGWCRPVVASLPTMTEQMNRSPFSDTGGFIEVLGLRLDEVGPDRVVISWDVTPALHQPYGIVHGGVHAAVVETAASLGAASWLGEAGHVVGVSNHTDFLRAVRTGTLRAVGEPIHRGRLQQLWLVEIRDEAHRLVARGEVRLQNITDADRLAATPPTHGADHANQSDHDEP
jgi:1,4-dihydroxy-2-naphthoyl-CoA hydrolase